MGDEGIEPPTPRCKQGVIAVSPIARLAEVFYASNDLIVKLCPTNFERRGPIRQFADFLPLAGAMDAALTKFAPVLFFQ